MVEKEVIYDIIETIINKDFKTHLNTKCRPSIDEVAFSKLKTNKEVADFFGLEYLPDGKPDGDNTGFNENIAFYDKRNHCLISFSTHDDLRIKGLDFNNNHIDGENGDYVANLKDVIRAYYEAPYILKKATHLIQFENGSGIEVGGDCNMYTIGMYRPSIWGDVRETLYHEMSHALAFQSIDWKNGEKLVVGKLPDSIKDRWEKATQQDYDFQKKNNLPHQDTSEYGETNPSEDFAEMGAVISSKITKSDYGLDSSYRVYVSDETRPSGRRFSHRMTMDEIIEANPNRAKLMREIMSDTKQVKTENKREYRNKLNREMAEMFDEEPVETW